MPYFCSLQHYTVELKKIYSTKAEKEIAIE